MDNNTDLWLLLCFCCCDEQLDSDKNKSNTKNSDNNDVMKSPTVNQI